MTQALPFRLRVAAVVTLMALLSQVPLLAGPARAAAPDDPRLSALRALLTDVNTWTAAVGATGRLAEPLPLAGSSAGAVVGIGDLVSAATSELLSGKDSYDDLQTTVRKDVRLDDDRTADLELTRDGDQVAFRLDVTATREDQPLLVRSADPKLELSSAGGVTLTGRAVLDLALSVDSSGHAHVVRTATSPRLTVDTTTSLPSAAPGLAAAFGILAAGVTADPLHRTATAHLVGTVDDPDGDGRLYRTLPTGTPGELADPAGAVGLWTVSDLRSGTVDARLAVTSVAAAGLPAVEGEITLSGSVPGALTVDTSGLAAVAAFERVTPRDLADMLGQLVTLVGGAQRTAADVDLPFLTGSLADAVPAAEALREFLEETVTQAGPGVDPAQVGQPTWRSLQELLAELDGFTSASGAVVTASAGKLDAASRLPLDLTIRRTSEADVDLAPRTVAVSGANGVYTPKTVRNAQRVFTRDHIGRRIVGGTSGGTIAAVSPDGTTATLAGRGWVPSVPDAGQPWSVSGPEPDAGTVRLSNLVATGTARIDAANAVRATARSRPEYTVHLPVALDLSAPVTGQDCTGTPLKAPCPFARTNADGSKTVVMEFPLAVERLLVKTGDQLLRADVPVTAPIELSARTGFVEVAATGTVTLSSPGAAPMQTITIKGTTADAGYLRITSFFRSLVESAQDLLSVATNLKGEASGTVSVPDLPGLVGKDPATFALTDLAADSASPTVTTSPELDRLLAVDLDPTDDAALRGVLLRTLQQLDEQLSSGDGGGTALTTPVPLVDTSLRDLLAAETAGGGETVTYAAPTGAATATVLTDTTRTGARAFPADLVGRSVVVGTEVGLVTAVLSGGEALRLSGLAGKAGEQPVAGARYVLRSELADALDLVTAAPPDTLQDLVALLDERLGTTLGVALGETGSLVLSLDWDRTASRSAPLRLDLGGRTLATTPDERAVRVEVRSTLDLDLDVPLVAQPLAAVPLQVLGSSRVDVDARLALEGAASATLGSLALSLGEPGQPDRAASLQGRYDVALKGGGGAVDLARFLTAAEATLNDYDGGVDCTNEGMALCADLPLYTQGDGGAWSPLSDSATSTVTVRLPKADAFDLSDAVQGPSAAELSAESAAEPLDVAMFADGLDAYLALVEQSLVQATLDGRLPLVGDDLQSGNDFVGTLRAALSKHLAGTAPTTVRDLDSYLGASLTAALPKGVRAAGWKVEAVCDDEECAPDAPLSAVDAVVLTGDLSQTLAEKTIPLDIGVPGLSVRPSRSDTAGGVTSGADWRLHLALSLDREDGFTVLTQDAVLPEFGLDLGVDLETGLTAELAVLAVDVTDESEARDLGAVLQVDLKADADEASCWKDCTARKGASGPRLSLADLQAAEPWSDHADLNLRVALEVDWLLKATADAALPGVQANLVMAWSHTVTSPDESEAEGLEIAFEEVAIDAGPFLTDVLGPVVQELKKVTGPVQPVLDTLYAPVPVLSDLSEAAGGPPVTLMTLATTFSTVSGGPKLEFVDTLRNLTTLVNNLPVPNGSGPLLVPIGSFTVSSAAWDESSTPDAAEDLVEAELYAKKTENGKVVEETEDEDEAADVGAGIDNQSKDQKKVLTRETTVGASAKGAGIAFPLLERPSLVFNLIMGGDIDLVTFDSGELELAFTWRQSYGPVYAPPPVMLTMSGSASITAQLAGGFDTYGLRKAFLSEGGAALDVLDGMYFATTDDEGEPMAVITLYGEIAAGAEVSAGIVSVGVEGGISLTVKIAWYDPDGDDKLRLVDFGVAVASNPLCLFQMSGELGLFLRANITIGKGFFSVSFDFTLAELTLLEFSAVPDCSPPPARLGGVAGDTLVVFAGALGGKDLRGHESYDNTAPSYKEDVVKVVSLHSFAGGTVTKTGVRLEMLGTTQEWSGVFRRVVVDGRGYTKPLKVTMIGDGDQGGASGPVKTADFDLDAVVLGGDGNDVVKTGVARSVVDGGKGNDLVTTSDRAGGDRTLVAGGPGGDSITTGNRSATVAGDSALGGVTTRTERLTRADGGTVSVDVVDWDALAPPSGGESGGDGNDRIALGRGDNTAYAGGGNDAVGVAADSPTGDAVAGTNTLVLGNGSDTARGGSGADTVWTSTQSSGAAAYDDGGADDTGTRNVVNSGAGNDTVFGSAKEDVVATSSTAQQVATVLGGAGDDVLVGGHGKDALYGGPGEDWVVAEPAQVGEKTGTDSSGTSVRTYSKDPLPRGVVPSTKTLVGGDGDDRIVGGDGGSDVSGDQLDTACAGAVSGDQTGDGWGSGRDVITGGSGVERVAAGGGDDRVTTGGGDDLVCGQAGNDVLTTGSGGDTAWGGPGADQVYGDVGADRLFGGGDADTLYGQDGADVLEGNGGDDRVAGGTGDDTALGGTRASGAADGGDQVYGDSGDDVLVGDNGSDTYPADLGSTDAGTGGNDALFGGAGADRAFGGLADDTVSGGDGADHLEGGPGRSDTVDGGAGEDELVGGSTLAAAGTTGFPDAADVLDGGADSDLVLGDNGRLEVGAPTPLQAGRAFTSSHALAVHDLGGGNGTSGSDTLRGGAGDDVLLGQGGADQVAGGAGDDHAEGGQGDDRITGDDGQDDVVGGSSTPVAGTAPAQQGAADGRDRISGGSGADVVVGDNARVDRAGPASPVTVRAGMTGRAVQLYDLGTAPGPDTSGGDVLAGDQDADVVLGQGGDDAVVAGDGPDHAEGGPGSDALAGGGGQDDLVGGSAMLLAAADGGDAAAGQPDGGDSLHGGAGQDLVLGDNAVVLPSGPRSALTLKQGMAPRSLRLLDQGSTSGSGADLLSGGADDDVLLGQSGDDRLLGGPGEDWLEGNGGSDTAAGDGRAVALPGALSTEVADVDALEGPAGADGQDDLIGGSSNLPSTSSSKVGRPGAADGADVLSGDGGADFVLGDNGTLFRGADPTLLMPRYGRGDAGAAYLRHALRLDVAGPRGTSGADTVLGGGGDDSVWGQDGDDTLRGGDGDDDLVGELGGDRLFGEDGDDAVLGDRGGIVSRYNTTADQFTATLNSPPKETLVGRRAGTLDRRVDQLHDVAAHTSPDSGSASAFAAAPLASDGITAGGNDVLRGGRGRDSLHGEGGEDLVNGDSGGDLVLGGDGSDALWGGLGCDRAVDSPAVSPDCYRTDGTFDPAARGQHDRFVDTLLGGRGGLSSSGTGTPEVLDWRPRGSLATPGTTCSVPAADGTTTSRAAGTGTVDPCTWFQATADATVATGQHHQGTDWMYGGQDRDAMEGDVSGNGQNSGDRMIDWSGVYNLWSHCNSAYGGFNDVRAPSPDMQSWLQKLAYAAGAGATQGNVLSSTGSGANELGLVTGGDTGKGYPTGKGSGDPYACSS